MLRDKRISVLMNTDIRRFEGTNKIESIVFTKNSKSETERNIEYYIKPDVIIAENGLGPPKFDIRPLLTASASSDSGEPPLALGIDSSGTPASKCQIEQCSPEPRIEQTG